MSERRSERNGDVHWSHGRRVWHRVKAIGYGLIGPWLSKKDDGTITLGWTACAATVGLVVMYLRLLPQQNLEGGWSITSVGWPSFLLIFVMLYSKSINKSLTALAKSNPGKLAELLLGKFGVGSALQQSQKHEKLP